MAGTCSPRDMMWSLVGGWPSWSNLAFCVACSLHLHVKKKSQFPISNNQKISHQILDFISLKNPNNLL